MNITLNEKEKIMVMQIMEMTQEAFEQYVYDGECYDAEVIAIWKFAKIESMNALTKKFPFAGKNNSHDWAKGKKP